VSHFWNVTAKDGNIYLGVHIGQDIKTPISYRRKVKTCLENVQKLQYYFFLSFVFVLVMLL